MVQKRIRKASLSQALREGEARHLSDEAPTETMPAPPPMPVHIPSVAPKADYDPIRHFVAPLKAEPTHNALLALQSVEKPPLSDDGALYRDGFHVNEVVKIRPQTQPKPATEPALTPQAPPRTKVEDTDLKTTQKPMNKPISADLNDAPTSFSGLGRVPETPTKMLRHNISDEELEILNAAKTRIEMRLFWVSMGIAAGSSIGAVPSLAAFNQTHILSLSGFFQNILFFAFTLLTLVLGVILYVKARDTRRAYRDITRRSRATDD
jgi:hypothetical protein